MSGRFTIADAICALGPARAAAPVMVITPKTGTTITA